MTENQELKARILFLESLENSHLQALKEVLSKKDKIEIDLWNQYITKVNSKFKIAYGISIRSADFLSDIEKEFLIGNQPVSVVLEFRKD